jgi:hypothetical protein
VTTRAELTIKRSWWKGTSRTSWRTTLENYIFSNTTKYCGENKTTFAAELSIDFEEEEFKKDMNDISVEVHDFKDANEALENQVEVCNDEKVKTEPDMKALEDQDEGQQINAFDAVKVKSESEV